MADAIDAQVDPQVARELYIKTGVVSRLYKEEQTYRLETAEAKQRVDKLKKDNADGADVRQAEAVVKDCEQMIPHTVKKLQSAFEDLTHLINTLEKDPIAQTEQFKDAQSVLQIVQTHWQSLGGIGGP